MFWHNTSDRSRVLPARGISAVDERELLQLNEGPPEAMSQHRSQRGGGVAAGGDSPGYTFADGEVRVGLTNLILGNGPEAPQYGSVFASSVAAVFRAIL